MAKRWMTIFLALLLTAAAGYGVFWLINLQVKRTFREGKELLAKGEFSQAAGRFEKVFQKRPNSQEGFESLCLLCQLMQSLEQKDKAMDYAQKYLERASCDKDKARAKYYVGAALFAKEKYAEAARELADGLKRCGTTDVADETMIVLATIKEQEGKYDEARELLKTVIERYPDSNLIKDAYVQYGRAGIKLLFSPIPTPTSMNYTVVQGDSAEKIAKRFGVTADLIKEANRLVGGRMRKGQIIKVEKGKFSLVISKSKNTLHLMEDGQLIKIYPVGTGKANCTPVGNFKITNKLVNPPWYKPAGGFIPFGSKENLLGTRWMGINLPGYGIHGTWEPDTIGKQASAGCVRLLNEDVEELYKIVESGTPVTIEN